MSYLARFRQARQTTIQQADANANKPDAWVGACIDGENVITGTLGPAWIWLNTNKGDQPGPPYQALNHKISATWNTPVKIGLNSQNQPEILGVADSQIDAFMSGNSGGSLYGQNVGQHSHELGFGNYDLVSDRRLREGLIWWRSVDGPYVVYMNEYWYFNASGVQQYYAGGVLDLTLLLTVVSGQHQWVKLGFDPIAGTPVAVAGSAVNAIAPLLASDLAAISFVGYIPLRGVQITFGQSIQGEDDFTDCSQVRNGFTGNAFIGRTPTATDYVMTAQDYLVGVTSTAAARAITLPPVASVRVGQTYTVKDESGGAATHNITVSPASGTIDGAGSKVISANYGFVRAYTDGTNWFTC